MRAGNGGASICSRIHHLAFHASLPFSLTAGGRLFLVSPVKRIPPRAGRVRRQSSAPRIVWTTSLHLSKLWLHLSQPRQGQSACLRVVTPRALAGHLHKMVRGYPKFGSPSLKMDDLGCLAHRRHGGHRQEGLVVSGHDLGAFLKVPAGKSRCRSCGS